LLLTVVGCGIAFNPLNSSTMAVAVVDMQRAFDIGFRDASLLISLFYVTGAVAQPVMGRLADRLGRKRLFLGGLAVVVGSSAAAPFCPSFGWLLAIRVLQALGSSTLYPAGFGIVRDTITERQGQALGVLATISSVTAAVGPTLGGALVAGFDWWAVFLFNAPLGVLVFGLAWYVLPSERRGSLGATSGGLRGWVRSFDGAGVVLFALALVSVLWFLLSVAVEPIWWLLLVGVVSGAAFIRRELSVPEPIIDVAALWANQVLTAVYVQYAMINIVFYALVFGLPSYLREAHGLDAVAAGLAMLPLAGLSGLALPLVGRLIGRTGPRRPLIAGAASMLGGSLMLLGIDRASGLPAILLVLCVFGVAYALNNLGLQAALYAAAPRRDMSAAAGLLQTSRYLGTILATSLLGIAFSDAITAAELHAVALVLAAVSVATLMLSVRRASSPRVPSDEQAGDVPGDPWS
jgi:MFS family permease